MILRISEAWSELVHAKKSAKENDTCMGSSPVASYVWEYLNLDP